MDIAFKTHAKRHVSPRPETQEGTRPSDILSRGSTTFWYLQSEELMVMEVPDRVVLLTASEVFALRGSAKLGFRGGLDTSWGYWT